MVFGLALFVSGFSVFAAPKLRLDNTAVGPISVAVGANAAAQSVHAYNAGDGVLNLSLQASAAWLQPALGAPRACAQGTCIPVNIGFATTALAAGMHTATVIVADPNALDAPQTITVTVQVGGSVPDKVDFFVPPNGQSASTSFTTSSRLTSAVQTQNGRPWLAMSLDGSGTFQFSFPYRITATHLAGMGDGVYPGAITTTGSAFPPDNKQIAVHLTVTSQPIAQLSSRRLQFRIAQGASAQSGVIVVTNAGLGALQVGNIAVEGNNTAWLTATRNDALVVATANPAGLNPGAYTASLKIEANGAVPVQTVPVELVVVANQPPLASFGGVVNNATFQSGDAVSPGDICALFGEQLSFDAPASAPAVPLPRELGGAKVLVNGQPAPIYFTSYGQINFQMPFEIGSGEAIVQVERGGIAGNRVTVQVARRAPRILRTGIGNYGIVVNPDGSFAMPTTPGLFSRPARRGEALVIYAIGLGATTPAVVTGAGSPAAEPLGRAPNATVYVGGSLIPPQAPALYTGLTPNFVGLYQINFVVPFNAPSVNNASLFFILDGFTSNTVEIAIQ